MTHPAQDALASLVKQCEEWGHSDDSTCTHRIQLSHLKEALSALQSASREWMPIESAPKDCTEILVYDPAWSDRGIAHVFWDGDIWQVVGNDNLTAHLKPERWRHLPALPTPPKQGA